MVALSSPARENHLPSTSTGLVARAGLHPNLVARLLADLERIDAKSLGTFVPRAVVHDYIYFRQLLHDMGERVEGAPGTAQIAVRSGLGDG